MSPVSEHQTKAGAELSYKAWKSYLLYFRAGPVIAVVALDQQIVHAVDVFDFDGSGRQTGGAER